MVLESKTKTTNESIKQELLNSLKENDDVEEQGLNETANSVNNSQEAIVILRRHEEIIKTKQKVIAYIGKQGELFKNSVYW